MAKPELSCVIQPEMGAITHGVVIFIVNNQGEILYGEQLIDNGRGKPGDLSLPGESRKKEDRETKIDALYRTLKEEIGEENIRFVQIPEKLREAWLGSIRFSDGVNAQVFCLRWAGGNMVPARNTPNGDGNANDFLALGWAPLDNLLSLEHNKRGMRSGMRQVIRTILRHGFARERILQVGRGTEPIPHMSWEDEFDF